MSEWISCKERLPKPNEFVGKVQKYYLIQTEYGDMMVACLDSKRGWQQIFQYGRPIDSEIVAWMPLPKEYKESENKEE